MGRLSGLAVKALWLSTMLLMCVLAGCGDQGTSARSRSHMQQGQGRGAPQGDCPAEGLSKDAGASGMVYAVSWDALATDADNNRGISTLQVSALDAASGKLLWQKVPAKMSGMYQSSRQQVVDGVLYIASSSSQSQSLLVLAVDIRDGHAIWQYEQKQGSVLTNICAGKIYLRSNAEVKALRANDGKVLWAKSYGEQQGPSLSLVVNGQTVYVINQVQSRPSLDPTMPVTSVQALDGESGKVMWIANMPPNMEQIKVLRVNDTIYLNGQDLLSPNQSLLVALQASDGKRIWQREHSYDQITVLDRQDLYGYKGYGPGDDPRGKKLLCSLDGTTGQDRWCVDSLQPSQFSLSATRDRVIVEEVLQPGPLTLVQNLYGVSKQDGKILWKLPWKSSSASVQTLTLVMVVEGQSFTSLLA
jgi:outer membrane protein assembly factor BamB